MSLGTHQTLLKITQTNHHEDMVLMDPITGSPAKEFVDPLLQAAQMTLFRHVNSIINMLPIPHRIINYEDSVSIQEKIYRDKMEDYLSEPSSRDTVFQLAAAMLQYLVSLPMLPWQSEVPEESAKDVCRFSLLCLEVS